MKAFFKELSGLLLPIAAIFLLGVYVGKLIAFAQVSADCNLMSKSRYGGNVITCNLIIEKGGVK